MKYIIVIMTIMSSLASCVTKKSSNEEVKNYVEKLNKFNSNEVLTRERIENENDTTLEELIFTNIYANIKVDLKSTDEDYKNQFRKFTLPQQTFYSTLTLERNVKYFGFKGYFEHKQSVGQFVDYAYKGYKELGLPEISNTVNKATTLLKSKQELPNNSYLNLDTILLNQVIEKNSSKERIRLIRQNLDSFVTKR